MTKQSIHKLNNKGYSLVEIVVVLAIMAIGVGIFSVSLAVISANNVRSCATDTDVLLSRGKVNANYREPMVYIEISDDGTNLIGNYYEAGMITSDTTFDPGELKESKVLGANTISVDLTGFTDLTGAPVTALPIYIAFMRGTGEMMQAVETGGSFTMIGFPGTNAEIAMQWNTTGTRYIIDLVPFTGMHEVRAG